MSHSASLGSRQCFDRFRAASFISYIFFQLRLSKYLRARVPASRLIGLEWLRSSQSLATELELHAHLNKRRPIIQVSPSDSARRKAVRIRAINKERLLAARCGSS